MRRFLLIGSRAQKQGKLNLNDLAGAAGRLDVLIRGLMAGLLTSHGIRENVEVFLALNGGPGPQRILKFSGSEIKGLHANARSVAGIIGEVISEPMPPKGRWVERRNGVYDSTGTVEDLMASFDHSWVQLDAEGTPLWEYIKSQKEIDSIGFILGDDRVLDEKYAMPISLGSEWLQGSACISICHFILDTGPSIGIEPNR